MMVPEAVFHNSCKTGCKKGDRPIFDFFSAEKIFDIPLNKRYAQYMSREKRLLLANFPHHIIQRGHNRQTVFAGEGDYRFYLKNLEELKVEFECRVYTYCLMPNHVHLVIDPGDAPENLSRLMKHLAGRQTRYANKKTKRSGTLWEGRFKSSPIAANEYLLACCRYVELNPLRAGLVEDPTRYPWSGCGVRTGLKKCEWLDFDPYYMGLGKTPEGRAQRYRKWLLGTIEKKEMRLIREAAQRGKLTASRQIEQEVSRQTGRRIELRGPGRPKKK
ncbi:MAG: transposase [Desulfobacterales bacterium]